MKNESSIREILEKYDHENDKINESITALNDDKAEFRGTAAFANPLKEQAKEP